MFRWYVVNTYSGHENKVKHNLEHRIVSLGQQRAIRQIVVPTESVSEMKDNQKVTIEKRTMPGYVLVNMDLNEDSWTLVKGTPGVTGFVGASNEPVPLRQDEVNRLRKCDPEPRHVPVRHRDATGGVDPREGHPRSHRIRGSVQRAGAAAPGRGQPTAASRAGRAAPKPRAVLDRRVGQGRLRSAVRLLG